MFLSETHLPQVLDAQCYHRREIYDREKDCIFLPSWQCIGTLDELPEEGSFFTRTVFEHPILVWMKDSIPRAFINVCAHRFANLTNHACGKTDKLTCQYHGWQYNASGKTQRIPDAVSFKPLADQQLGLNTLPLEIRGQLLFTNLKTSVAEQKDSNATGRHQSKSNKLLSDQLAEAESVVEDIFSSKYRQVFARQTPVPANWKVIVENAIESYHVGCVHAKSFAVMPAAETCHHQLHDTFTRFETNSPSQAPVLLQAGERWIHRQMGIPHVERYRHYHLYPNTLFSTSKMISVLMVVEPTGPRESTFHLRIFCNRGTRTGPLSRLAFQIASRWAIKEVNKVLQEDFNVIPHIQNGIESPSRPGSGLISIREERIFHFQKYIDRYVTTDSRSST